MFAQNILFSDVIELLLEYLIDKLLTSIYYLFTIVDDGRVWSMTTDWVVQCAFLFPFFGNKHRQSGTICYIITVCLCVFCNWTANRQIFFHGGMNLCSVSTVSYCSSLFLDTFLIHKKNCAKKKHISPRPRK